LTDEGVVGELLDEPVDVNLRGLVTGTLTGMTCGTFGMTMGGGMLVVE
jgi:hypothetical protein